MAHTLVRDVPPEPDKTLFLIMDGENNLTADPKTLDSIVENRQRTEVKIMRILASSADSDESDDEDDADRRPKVNLTFEEILPENPDDESKVGDPSVPPDIVDPFSHLDTEAMQRLKKALASDQAKQILGDNVAAMLDVLSVEDPASFIRNTIKRDHCYTPLSPSADPRGPSFVMSSPTSSSKMKGPILAKAEAPKASGSGVPKQQKKVDQASESEQEEDDESESEAESESGSSDRSSDSDYHDPNSGFRRDRRKKRVGRPSAGRGRRGRPPREKPREPTPDEQTQEQEVSATVVRGPGKRGRPRKDTSRLSTVATPIKAAVAEEPTPTPPVEAIPVDNVAAKALSADAIRLGRSVKSEEERKRDMARILEKLDGGRGRKIIIKQAVKPPVNHPTSTTRKSGGPEDALEEGEVTPFVERKLKPVIRTYERQNSANSPVKSPPTVVRVDPIPPKKVESAQPQNVMGGKYPRRENRKLPSHLLDTIGPELFSSPDSLRRKEDKAKTLQKTEQKPISKAVVQKKDEELAVAETPSTVVKPAALKEKRTSDALTELESMLEEGLEETKPVPVKVVHTSATEKHVDDLSMSVEPATPTATVVEAKKPAVSNSADSPVVRPVRAKRASREVFEHEVVADISLATSRRAIDPKKVETVEANLEQSIPNEDPEIRRRRSSEMSEIEELDSDIDDVLSEASWNSEDDPDKLWCICRKPHNNRFMICCDNCEEWFHGKCVGITKSIGKQMEQDGLDWTCPPCTKKKRAEEKEKELKAVGKPKPADVKPTIQTKLSFVPKRKCIMCSGSVRENSIYCSDQCIRKHSQKAIAQLNPTKQATVEKPVAAGVSAPVVIQKPIVDRRVIVMDPNSKKVLTGQSAPKLSNLATWLKQNPSFHVILQKTGNPESTVKKIVNLQQVHKVLPGMRTPGKIVLSRPAGKVVQSLKVGNKPAAGQMQLTVSPNSKHIKIVTRTEPITKPLQQPVTVIRKTFREAEATPPLKVKVTESPKPAKKEAATIVPPKRKRKEKLEVLDEYKPMPVTGNRVEEVRRETGDEAVRENVRKTLGDALKARASDAKEITMSSDDIDALVAKIEEKLYSFFGSKTDSKYKSRYRMLLFNIKDAKNTTLYRKILQKSISPKHLVRLNTDQLASQELAQWREKENQHNLEMIKKTELENLKINQTIIMKSHKGEEVLEKDSDAPSLAAEIDPNISAKELVSALNSVSSTTPDNDEKQEKKRGSETSLMKMKKKERERSRDSGKDRDRHRKRSRSRSRSRRSKSSKKRSRSKSRDRHRHSRDKKSSRHSSSHSSSRRSSKDEKKTSSKEKVDKIEEEVVPTTTVDTPLVAETEPEKQEALLSDDADYEPTSTVNIKTPEITQEEPEEEEPEMEEEKEEALEPEIAWAGEISYAEVAKFKGKAVLLSGTSTNLLKEIPTNLTIAGRVRLDTAWDYLSKQKALAVKDILVVRLLPNDEDQVQPLRTLHHYMYSRSRVGAIDKFSDFVKDFYIYAYNTSSPVPVVLQPLNIPATSEENVLLGIIVGIKPPTETSSLRPPPAKRAAIPRPSSSSSLSKSLRDVVATSAKAKTLPLPEISPESGRSRSPSSLGDKQDSKKRKIKVQVAVASKPPMAEDDSPYEPASSDEDLPPLSKIPKIPVSGAQKKYTPKTLEKADKTDAEQIQKRIEEMNRAIEEQTQQIQSLASTVPLLPVIAPVLQTIPGLGSCDASVLNTPSTPVPSLGAALQSLQSIVPVVENLKDSTTVTNPEPVEESIDIPMPPSPPRISQELNLIEDGDEKMDVEVIPANEPAMGILPEIAFPSNLQEILASIQKSSADVGSKPAEDPSPELITLAETPPPKTPKKKIDMAEIFEETKSVNVKSKQPIKFDLKLKTKDVDERVAPVGGASILTVLDIDDRSMDQRVHGNKTAVLQDQDYRLLPRPISSSVEIPLPSSSQGDRSHRRERRRSDADHRKGKPKNKIEAEWEDSIRVFEEEQRRRKEEIREKEIEMLRRRSDED